MTAAELIGSIGVGALLAAFGLRSLGHLEGRDALYHAINVVGALLAAYASWRIGFMPFVVLEATWAAVAAVALVRSSRPVRR